jgi:hypothetical protein
MKASACFLASTWCRCYQYLRWELVGRTLQRTSCNNIRISHCASASPSAFKAFSLFPVRPSIAFMGCAVISTVMLSIGAPASAQQSVLPPATKGDSDLLSGPPSAWSKQNRYLELFGGLNRQDYRETDTFGLTKTGALDTEIGNQRQVGAVLRWQTSGDWLFHLQGLRQTGATNYDGYLQTGIGGLVPLRARTGNIATRLSANIGYAINAKTWTSLGEDWQITPLIQIAWHQWERNLVQYQEEYDFRSHGIGALLQWQAGLGTLVEAQFVVGRTQSANVSAPQLGFIARQPGADFREIRVGVIQSLTSLTESAALKGWHATVRFTASQYQHGASPLVNGLQAPPNQSKPTGWTLGLQRQF